jgi:hypothetical protein
MALARTETELRGWLDRLAIQDLLYRYSDAVTRADWGQCEAVFAPDAIWESPAMGTRFEDRAAFLEVLKATATSGVLIQTASAPVIRLTGPDRAQATITVHELVRGATVIDSTYGAEGAELNFEQYGVYFDDIARTGGEWKFTHRLFVPIYMCAGCVTGDVVTQRSALLRPE